MHENLNIVWQELKICPENRNLRIKQTPYILWFTGLSGAGKSTIANIVDSYLHRQGKSTFVLDGDNIRHGLCRDLTFSAKDRAENIRRIAEVSKLMMEAGLIVLVAAISPFKKERRMVRSLFPIGRFFEIFVDTSLDTCMKRDVKGLYKRAIAGEVKNMTSLSSPYEKPESPELILNGEHYPPDILAEKVLALLQQSGLVD